MPIIVFVNGIDDADPDREQRAVQREAQRYLLRNQFYDTYVEFFDAFTIADRDISRDYLLLRAKLVIARLCELARNERLDSKETIVFVAHNIGAALVKQVLLLALEDRRISWIALQTVALHLVETPSYTEDRKWEDFLFRLLSAGRVPLYNLATVLLKLPGQLTRAEIQFSAISQAYEIQLHSRPADAGSEPVESLWFFGDDGTRLVPVFDSIRASMRRTNPRLRRTLYRGLVSTLAVPEAVMGRLSPSSVDLDSMLWLEDNKAYKAWLAAPGSSLLALTGSSGSGKNLAAMHVFYSLRTRDMEQHAGVDQDTMFLSYGFHQWDATRNTEWGLVSSLVRQFLLLRPDAYPSLAGVAVGLYDIKRASCAQLWQLFRYMLTIPCANKVYIVVNAADQCQTDVRAALASLVTAPSGPRRMATKIFMTFSGEDTLPQSPAIHTMPLEESRWKHVVYNVAYSRVWRLVEQRPVWRGKEEDIVERMTFSGNYLHCILSLELLEHSSLLSTRAALQQHMMVPPPPLELIFQSLLNHVRRSSQATIALQWVYHAIRPLTVSELAVALGISSLLLEERKEEGSPARKLSEQHGQPRTTVPLLRSASAVAMLTFDDLVNEVSWDLVRDLADELGAAAKTFNEQVTLVHRTFRRYLEDNASTIVGPAFHAAIAEMCLWYIREASKIDTDENLETCRLDHGPIGIAADLLDYAELYWVDHLKLAGDFAAYLDEQVVQFLTEATDQRGIFGYRKRGRSQASSRYSSRGRATSHSRARSRRSSRPRSQARSETSKRDRSAESTRIPEIELPDTAHSPEPTQADAESIGAHPAEEATEAAAEPNEGAAAAETTAPEPTQADVASTEACPAEDTTENAVEPNEGAAAAEPTEQGKEDASAEAARPPLEDPTAHGTFAADSDDGIAEETDSDTSTDGGHAYTIPEPEERKYGQEPPIRHWISYSARLFSWPEAAAQDPLCTAIQLGLDRAVESMLSTIDLATTEPLLLKRIENALLTAGNSGCLKVIDRVLAVTKTEPQQRLPVLCLAARKGHMDIVTRLLQDIEDTDVFRAMKTGEHTGYNPLIDAIEGGQQEVVQLLLEKGVSMLSADDRGNNAVHAAIKTGDVEILRLLIALRGGDVKNCMPLCNKDDANPLQIACQVGYVEPFTRLLELAPDAPIDKRGRESRSPLQICAELGHLAIWEKLVEAGADPLAGEPTDIVDIMSYRQSVGLRSWKNNNPTEIELASRCGHYEMVSRILQLMMAARSKEERKKAKEQKKKKRQEDKEPPQKTTEDEEKKEDGDEETEPTMDRHTKILVSSLFEACSNGHVKLVKLLLENTERNAKMDLKHLRLAIGRGHLDVIKTLHAAGVSLHHPEHDYDSHLDLAISENFVDVVRYLITTGGLRSQWDGFETSIQYAARCGYILSLRLLLYATDVEPSEVRRKSVDGPNAVELAARACELATFRELLKWEKAHDAEDLTPMSALILSIESHEPVTKKTKFIEFLLSNGWDPNASDGTDSIPLHAAIVKRDLDLVEMLLNLNANPNTTDNKGNNALHIVAAHDVDSMVRVLVDKDADPAARNELGYTPLHLAARAGHEHTARLLLGLDAYGDALPPQNLDARRQFVLSHISVTGPGEESILHYAANNVRILKVLFEAKETLGLDIDINAVNDRKITALMLAALQGPDTAVEFLLEKGADAHLKDAHGETAMFFAARRVEGLAKDVGDVFRLLVKYGAEVNVLGGALGSLLYTTLWAGLEDQADFKTLLDLGATADVEAPPFGSPLHLLLLSSTELEKSFQTTAPILVEHGAKVDALDSRGRTPLLFMVSHARTNEGIVKLLELGANPNARDAAGMTPLHYVVVQPDMLDVVQPLLEHGADFRALDAAGRSVLYMAALINIAPNPTRFAFDKLVECLPEEEQLRQKSMALPAAIKNGYEALYESILDEAGVDINVPDRNGWTALDIATAHLWEDIAEMLVEKGAVRGTDKKMPTRLSRHDANTDFFVSDDGTEAGMLDYDYNRFYNEYLNGTVRADHCISQDEGIFYFEVEILRLPWTCSVAIGLTLEHMALDDMVGWAYSTWGYHSDDGSVLSKDSALDNGEMFGAGDVVGLAYDLASRKVWFTKNGKLSAVSWRPLIEQRAEEEQAAKQRSEAASKVKKTDDDDDGHDGEEDGGEDDDGEDENNADGENGGEDDKKGENDNGDDTNDNDGENGGNDGDNDSQSSERIEEPKERARAALARGQLYPCVSFQHANQKGITVRVNFGPTHGAAGTPFRYAAPTVVPDDPPAKGHVDGAAERGGGGGGGGGEHDEEADEDR